jgi:predicted ArsR family transcriptional regulator
MEGSMEDITDLLSDSQTRLVELIKKRGEVTVDQAVDALDLATTTIRQHLERLENEDLVEHRRNSVGRGRPRHVYRLSSRAEQLFPSLDRLMLHRLLDFLSTEGHHRAIDDFFHEFWDERGDEFRRRLDALDDESREARLNLLSEFLDEQGFMPEIDHDEAGSVEIRECHCPLSKAVESTRLPCRLEAEFLEQVVGQSLERVSYMPDGNNACVYEFRADDEET